MPIRSREEANAFERQLRRNARALASSRTDMQRRRPGARISSRPILAIGVVVVALLVIGYELEHRTAEPVQPFPYRDCNAAHVAGVRSIPADDLRYSAHQDRDGDGVACEPYP